MVPDKVALKNFYIDKSDYPDAVIIYEDELAEYANKAGVWACWGKDKKDSKWVCLNVGSGKTIGKEIRVDLKYSKGEFKHKDGVFKNYNNEKVFDFIRPKDEPITIRERVWFDIGKKYKNLAFVILILSDDEHVRLKVEEDYATHEKIKALYWNPSPRQIMRNNK